MKKSPVSPAIFRTATVTAFLALSILPVNRALAEGHEQERIVPNLRHEQRADPERHRQRDERGLRHIERVERGEGRYRSPAWEYDSRFRHNHYYPRHGSYVTGLPPDYLDIEFRGNRFYFQGGVWFRRVGLNFEVTAPPYGIGIPILPPAYTTVWLDSQPYYYANDIYYTQAAASSGYVVVAPPVGIDSATVQPAPVVTPAPIVAPSPAVAPAQSTAAEVDAEPLFVYPRNKQSKTQAAKDRSECNSWASDQTGYAPSAAPDAQQRSNYRRAVSACMEGRGYTVR